MMTTPLFWKLIQFLSDRRLCRDPGCDNRVGELACKFKYGHTLTYHEPSTFSHDS